MNEWERAWSILLCGILLMCIFLGLAISLPDERHEKWRDSMDANTGFARLDDGRIIYIEEGVTKATFISDCYIEVTYSEGQ